MVLRIRLARFGRKNLPFYRLFVADSRAPRDGRHVEIVGHYDPIPEGLAYETSVLMRAGKDGNKSLGIDIERIKYWMSVGAQPSQTVGRLLGQAGVMPKPPPPISLKTQMRGPKNADKGKKR